MITFTHWNVNVVHYSLTFSHMPYKLGWAQINFHNDIGHSFIVFFFFFDIFFMARLFHGISIESTATRHHILTVISMHVYVDNRATWVVIGLHLGRRVNYLVWRLCPLTSLHLFPMWRISGQTNYILIVILRFCLLSLRKFISRFCFCFIFVKFSRTYFPFQLANLFYDIIQ